MGIEDNMYNFWSSAHKKIALTTSYYKKLLH